MSRQGRQSASALGPMRDVVFDLGGVLIDWDPAYLFRDHLGGAPDEVAAFLSEICRPEWHATIDGGMDFEAAARVLVQRFPERAEWILQYGPGWEHMFRGEHQDAVECLETLGRQGYRLHALSNYPRRRIAFLYRRFPFMAAFHSVILSGLIGATKPGREIFEYLRGRLGGARCLFVDDRPENIAAAREQGIEAVLYRPCEGAGAVLERLRMLEKA